MRLKDKNIGFPEKDKVTSSYESAYYISKYKNKLIRIRYLMIASDIFDNCTISFSNDNGKTWSDFEPYNVCRKTSEGIYRKDYGSPFVDPVNGRLLVIATQSFLPSDNLWEALTYSFPIYRVSEDEGKTWTIEEQLIQKGEKDEFTDNHPLEGVWVGENAIHLANEPFRSSSGKIIWPAQRTVLNSEGNLFCPPGSPSYHEMVILIGTWRNDNGIDWEISKPIIIEPEKSTRGACEGAVAEMPDGKMLMVIRASNELWMRNDNSQHIDNKTGLTIANQEDENAGRSLLPGYKWYCISEDGGYTWDKPKPWRYSDGSLFYSPSSYSRILRHSNGKYYWFGNICPKNPRGNLPRYPFVTGEIDVNNFMLIKESLIELDTLREEDEYPPQMGNFNVYEERDSGDIVLRMTREFADGVNEWGSSYIYRIEI